MTKLLLSAKAVFDHAHEITAPEERRAYLDQACGENAPLRSQVEALLQAYDQAGSFLGKPAAAEGTSDVPPGRWLAVEDLPVAPIEGAGSLIGPYKLLQQIGEGGMGVVFMAEQQQPVRRMVALKVIKAGMDTAQVIARFEAERQALALMDHPHIAKVLDAGTTASGRPYFVMELVKGIPVTKYCDEQRFSPKQRLELFIPVCQAIQHAHQKGIIHRDIKPSNVLVADYDGKPTPKIIDFGVAKAMGQKLTERTLFTGFGGIVGTLEYMSPEQAELNALDIDTRSDIYSLGVLLYELLTGTTPLTRQRLKDAALTEVLRLIREEEPPRPSTRLSETKDTLASVSAQRQMEPDSLVRAVRGEVDWIVMKALEKDRTRRYETANGLARDIQRYLTDEPVEAGPPSATYRLRKLAWKHRRSLTMAATLLLLLITGVVASTVLAAWALKERDRAVDAERTTKRSEEDTRAVLGFFEQKVLSASRPRRQDGGQGVEVTLRQAVDTAEPGIAESFKDRPLVEASIRTTMGMTYWYAGHPAQAVKQHKRAFELRESLLGSDHPDTNESRGNLAQAYRAAGNTAEALRLFEETLRFCEAVLGPDNADTLIVRGNLANTYADAGRFEDTIRLHKQNLEQREATLGIDHYSTLLSRNNLAHAYDVAERFAEAVPLLEQNLKLSEAKLGVDHPVILTFHHNLAAAYLSAGRTGDAIRHGEQVLNQQKRILGDTHPTTLTTLDHLGKAYSVAGRNADAISMHEQTLKLRQEKLGIDHPDTLESGRNLAEAYLSAGRTADAIRLAEQTRQRQKTKQGPEHPFALRTLDLLGRCYLQANRYADAASVLHDCLKVREAKQPDAWSTFNTRSLLGGALLGQKKYADAEPLLLQGCQGMKEREAKIPAPSKIRLSESLQFVVQLYDATGKKDQANKWHQALKDEKNAAAKARSGE